MKNNNLDIVKSLYDKQEILSNVAGFYAPTSRELSESLAIIGTRETVGVNQHLQEVYRRQQNNRVDKPENAIKSIAKEYVANYRSSESIKKYLGLLAIELSEICNPNIKVIEEVNHIASGHMAFVRYIDLRSAYRHPDNDANQREALGRSYFSRDKLTTAYVAERLGEITVKESRKLIKSSILDQENRSAFWLDTLKKAQVNRIASPIIRIAINNL